jgi:excisionase family DNA binding protein
MILDPLRLFIRTRTRRLAHPVPTARMLRVAFAARARQAPPCGATARCCFSLPDLLTAREVGERFGVSTETILRWTRRGDLPGFRMPGGALRYREAELDEWLTGRATPGREVSSNPTSAAGQVRYLPSSSP